MAITISGTTGIAGVDGSAGTPAVQGTDTNTGVFYPAADTVGVSTGGSERVRVDSSGNVGIGTSTPAANLDVQATTGPFVRIKPTTVTSYGYLGFNNTGGDFNIGRESSGGGSLLTGSTGYASVLNSFGAYPMQFGTNGVLRMTIDSSGNLLVGKTITATTSLGWSLGSGLGNAKFSTGNYMIFNRDDNDILINFRRSDTSVGTITVTTTATAYNTSSDYRLKHDIQPMSGALAKVAALKPVTYKWNADNSDGEGFIAHELQEVVPQCVTGEKDAVDAEGNPVYQGIDTSFLVAILTAAIQEQQALITALTARIEELETK